MRWLGLTRAGPTRGAPAIVQAREKLDLVAGQTAKIQCVGKPVDERATYVVLHDGEGVWKAFDDLDTSLHRGTELFTEASAPSFVPRKGLGQVSCGLGAVKNPHCYSALRRRS